MGSVLFKDFVPAEDAHAVERLREAGAIVLGKTVTTVFANLDPGPTRNPWNSSILRAGRAADLLPPSQPECARPHSGRRL